MVVQKRSIEYAGVVENVDDVYKPGSERVENWTDGLDPKVYNYDVTKTPLYKKCYELFSGLSDKSWLNLLISYGQTPSIPGQTIGDFLGFTNNAETAASNAFNEAIANIQNLLQDYYEWRNDLPSTQVSQASAAGVNLAVTGSTQASSLDMSDASPVPQIAPADSSGAISTAVGAVSTVLSTVGSLYKNAADIQQARMTLSNDSNKYLTTMWKTLYDAGFSVSGQPFKTFADLNSWIGANSSDPVVQTKFNRVFTDLIKSDLEFAPFKSYFTNDDGNIAYSEESFKRLLSESTNSKLSEVDLVMNKYAQYQVQTLMYDRLTERYMAQFDAAYSEGMSELGDDFAKADEKVKLRDRISAELQAAKDEIDSAFIQSLVDDWNSTNDPSVRYTILQLLYDMDIDALSDFELIESMGSPTLVKASKNVVDTLKDIGAGYLSRGKSIIGNLGKSGKSR